MIGHRLSAKLMECTKGNASILFALCLLPLVAIVGSTSDFKRLSAYEAKFERALDVTAVSTARIAMRDEVGDRALKHVAQDVFDTETASFSDFELNSFELQRNGDEIRLSVDAQVSTGLMQLVGQKSVGFRASSAAHFGDPLPAEVALVLDTSYSMRGSRLEALRIAASDMIDTLISANPETVKLSVVPFSTYVNVGIEKRGQSWLEVEPERSGSFERCAIEDSWYESKCERESYQCFQDGVQKTCLRWNCLSGDLKNAPKKCETIDWSEEWYGCVKSRSRPHNVSDVDYLDHRIVGVLTRGAEFCPTPIQALTNDRDTLIDKLESLRADQNTYIATGLIWGLRTLSDTSPFDEAEPYADYVSRSGRKALVLMSDGANTRSPTSDGLHLGGDRRKADQITREVCDEIKSQGIELYTIAFELDDRDTKTLLLNCATQAKYFFDADNAEALGRAFETIGDNFSNVALIE